MATSTGKTHCVKCGKDRCTLKCGGCMKEFCFNHLAEHRQELIKQLDDIEVNRDLFRQSLTEQMDGWMYFMSIQPYCFAILILEYVSCQTISLKFYQ